jgi:hypothetical protein
MPSHVTGLPNGNVGSPTSTLLEMIRLCRLPPSMVKSLGLDFSTPSRKRQFGAVDYEYGTSDGSNTTLPLASASQHHQQEKIPLPLEQELTQTQTQIQKQIKKRRTVDTETAAAVATTGKDAATASAGHTELAWQRGDRPKPRLKVRGLGSWCGDIPTPSGGGGSSEPTEREDHDAEEWLVVILMAQSMTRPFQPHGTVLFGTRHIPFGSPESGSVARCTFRRLTYQRLCTWFFFLEHAGTDMNPCTITTTKSEQKSGSLRRTSLSPGKRGAQALCFGPTQRTYRARSCRDSGVWCKFFCSWWWWWWW